MSSITLFGAADEGHDLTRVSRTTKKSIERVHEHALVAAARDNGMTFVASAVLQHVASLSMQEALIVEEVPHAAGRAKAVVDGYTMAAVGVIAQLGR